MKTILCVDDGEIGLQVRKQLLETYGFSVLTALTAIEALNTARREQIDLAILDYRLAETTTEELAARLKAEQPHLPILLLSGCPTIPDSARSAVDAFLAKDETAETLLATINSLLAVPKSKPSPFVSAPATIEASRKLIERAQEVVKQSDQSRERRRKRLP